MAYANIADPDQTVHEGSTLFTIPLSFLTNICIKKQHLATKHMELNHRKFRTFTVLSDTMYVHVWLLLLLLQYLP